MCVRSLAHLATVYDHKVMAMRLGRKPEEGEWVTDEPFGKDTVEWFADEHAKLLAELVAHSPRDYAWSWWEAGPDCWILVPADGAGNGGASR